MTFSNSLLIIRISRRKDVLTGGKSQSKSGRTGADVHTSAVSEKIFEPARPPFQQLIQIPAGCCDVFKPISRYEHGQLAVEANVSLQQITKTVNALEDMGYVRRYIDKANRRQVWVSLTEQCQSRIRSSCDANDGLLVKSFASLSDEDMLQLQKAACTITQIINKMEDRPLQDLTAKEDEK